MELKLFLVWFTARFVRDEASFFIIYHQFPYLEIIYLQFWVPFFLYFSYLELVLNHYHIGNPIFYAINFILHHKFLFIVIIEEFVSFLPLIFFMPLFFYFFFSLYYYKKNLINLIYLKAIPMDYFLII